MTRYLVPLLIGVIGAAILVALGVWQVQRLAWKDAVLAEIDARMAEAPVPLPDHPDPETDRYRPVIFSAALTGERAYVFVSVKNLGVRFRVIDAAVLPDGRRILVEEGTISDQLPTDLLAPPRSVEVQGMVHWPDEVDGFTPDPDRANNIWYARDLPSISAALTTEPLLVVANAVTPSDPIIVPLPVDPSTIPNDHLQYAVTWFGLAVVWLGMTVYWMRRIARARHFER